MQQGLTPLAEGMRALAIGLDGMTSALLPPPERVDLVIALPEAGEANPVEVMLRQLPVLAVFAEPPAVIIQARPYQAQAILSLTKEGTGRVYLYPAQKAAPCAAPAEDSAEKPPEKSLVASVWRPSEN